MESNLKEILKNEKFVDFNEKMFDLDREIEMNHTMLGFNFSNNQIISTKFYYVFYSIEDLNKIFPIPELKNIYSDLRVKKSTHHLLTKYSFGGGLTFVIKFDKFLNVTKGFYFRVDDNNENLINNIINLYPDLKLEHADFEPGYGQYVTLIKSEIKLNEYLYLSNMNKIKDSCGITFSNVKAIELSSAKSLNKKDNKFIAMGGSEIISNEFLNRLPIQLSNVDKNRWVCPAINFETGVRSIYYYNSLKRFSPELLSSL